MTAAVLKAPFPYFGGKSIVAPLVWERFGTVSNYVEPFMGSLAMLLNRPAPFAGTETVNDADGFVSNFWRATAADPEAVASHASWPVIENDLHARHSWLVGKRDDITRRLEGDPEWFDVKVAGWWVWGCCCWIGGGWCSGNGPWQSVETADGSRHLVRLGDAGKGVYRQRVHLGNGQGVNRHLVHLGDAGKGVKRRLVHLGDAGKGVHRKRVHQGDAGNGDSGLYEWFVALSDRLRHVRVCCGDWERICGPTPTVKHGITAVFLDPPYADTAGRDPEIYARDSHDVAHRVREWCIEHGDHPKLRIALCGYEGEHVMPGSWECVAWKTHGGYAYLGGADNTENAKRERVWFSPTCLKPERDRYPLFASIEDGS